MQLRSPVGRCWVHTSSGSNAIEMSNEVRLRKYKHMLVISGHTPTQLIEENPRPGYIYRHNNHVAIDCGACFAGGRLAAFCLDSGEEFYSSEREGEENG